MLLSTSLKTCVANGIEFRAYAANLSLKFHALTGGKKSKKGIQERKKKRKEKNDNFFLSTVCR